MGVPQKCLVSKRKSHLEMIEMGSPISENALKGMGPNPAHLVNIKIAGDVHPTKIDGRF